MPLNAANSLIANIGQTGSFYAVAKAMQYFEQTGNNDLLISGVDTYRDLDLPGKLDAEDRLNVRVSSMVLFPEKALPSCCWHQTGPPPRHIWPVSNQKI